MLIKRCLNVIIGIVFAGLLTGTAILQTHLKDKPQIFMLVLGILTFSSFVFRQNRIATILFSIILGVMLYVNLFLVTNFIVDILNTDKDLGELSEMRHRGMDMNWIWGVMVGIILSPLILIFYHINKLSNRMIETVTTVLFLTTTIVIYIIYEW